MAHIVILYANGKFFPENSHLTEHPMIYLDNSATTRVTESVAQVAQTYMTNSFYNPASSYPPSVRIEKEMLQFRSMFQEFGYGTDEVFFTSGGTESNNISVFGCVRKLRGKHRIITSKVEHPSVYNVFKYLQQRSGDELDVVFADVDRSGSVDLDQLSSLLNEETAFVSLMHVNNETGAVNDLGAVSSMIKKRSPGAVFHSDGVQAFCKLPSGRIPCDLYSISGHKLHAPKGVGVLLMKKNTPNEGGLIGGGQENGFRSGTSNVPSILALQEAVRTYLENSDTFIRHMRECKMRLYYNLISMEDVFVNGPEPDAGAPHILNLSFTGVRGEVLLNALAAHEIYVSTGSACSSSKKSDNRILNAMNLDRSRRESAVRFSLCPYTTEDEIDQASDVICSEVKKLRKYTRR